MSLAARIAGLDAEDAERAVEEALSERLVDDVAAVERAIRAIERAASSCFAVPGRL